MSTASLRPDKVSTPDSRSMRGPETQDYAASGRKWAETVDDAWDPCLLCCDGGGIRGYSSLLILKALMHEVFLEEQRQAAEEGPIAGEILSDEEDELLPCHYFDFMYGTSTGGLISIMLGKLRMRIDECLETYRLVGDKLFGHRRSIIPMATKYAHKPLEKAVQDIVSKKCCEHTVCDGKECLHPWELNDSVMIDAPWDPEQPRVCQSCCLTAIHNKSVITAHLLRSYPHFYNDVTTPNWLTRYNEGADPLTIWQATRATSAAPFYFQVLQAEIGDDLRSFKDGGIRENNPSGAAWNEFHSLYAPRKSEPALLLSVGTGRATQEQDGFATAWPGPLGNWVLFRKLFKNLEKFSVIPSLLVKYTESERQHQTMRNYALGEHTYYKRLNVTSGLGNMPLDDWRRGPWKPLGVEGAEEQIVPGGLSLTKMEQETMKYLERDYDPEFDTYAPPSTMLRQTAEKLVRQRRARARLGGERWDFFVGKHFIKKRESSTRDSKLDY